MKEEQISIELKEGLPAGDYTRGNKTITAKPGEAVKVNASLADKFMADGTFVRAVEKKKTPTPSEEKPAGK